MGRTVCEAVKEADGLELSGRADPALGVELAELLPDADVMVDFTTPETALTNAQISLEAGVHAVIGTTGFDLERLRAITEGAGANAFVAPNFAIGAVLMMRFAAEAATHLSEVEIVELHHAAKLDAPSGTATRTASLIADAGGNVHEPIHSVRLPGLVAHQEVLLGGARRDADDPPRLDRSALLHARGRARRPPRGRAGPAPDRGPGKLAVETVVMESAAMDATAQAELVRSGEASPTELVEEAIARVEALNPEVNAVIHELFEQGHAEAASPELPDGPFKGVPFLFKDLGAAYAGQPLHMGMRALKEADFRAPADTYLAERFRAAGFVVIGKTNVPELGILPTTEPDAYGPSRNPWDLERTTGGSSGGSAAAVAAGMVSAAHANDGGGSIRIPASICGLVGLKPTRQRISEGPLVGDNITGLTAELAVTRSVRDTAAILDAVEGSAPGDPYVAPPPTRPYVEELSADGTLRIGVLEEPPVEGLDSHPDCVTAVRETVKLLESFGHEVSASSPMQPGMAEALNLEDSFLTRWAASQEASLDIFGLLLGRELTAGDVEPLTWALAEEGRARTSGRYLRDHGLHQVVPGRSPAGSRAASTCC